MLEFVSKGVVRMFAVFLSLDFIACKSLRAMAPYDYTRMISALSDIHIVREIHFDYG